MEFLPDQTGVKSYRLLRLIFKMFKNGILGRSRIWITLQGA